MDDEHQVQIAGDTQKWFTMVPNMVDDMRLDPYAYRLYGHIRRVAGEGGKCYQSSRYLADVCQMSVAKVSEAKQVLVNVGLIEVTRTWIGEGKIGRDHIRVIDIWKRNFERYGGDEEPAAQNGVIAVRTQESERVFAVRTQADRSQGDHKSDRCAIPKEEPVLKKNPVGGERPLFSAKELAALWQNARMLLEATMGNGSFYWLRDAELIGVKDGEATVAVASENARQMCQARLGRPVAEALEQLLGDEVAPVFVVAEKAPRAVAAPDPPAQGPDLEGLWKRALAELKAQGLNVREFAGSRIQAIERVDDECRRAVIVGPRPINRHQWSQAVATTLTAAVGQQVIVSFLSV